MRTKILTWIFTVSIGVFGFASCDSDEKYDYIFSAESLKQTTWEGTEVVTDGNQIIRSIDIVMQFFNTDNGQYILKEGLQTEVYHFKYSIEDKMMNIEDGPLFSKRTLLEANKDKMVLESFGSYKCTMTLSKKY